MKIGEMFVQLGVKADTFTVKDFVRSIGEIPFSVGAAITSLTGMSLGFADMFKNTLESGNALAMFRSQTGLSTDELQRWQGVAKQVGVSGDAVTSSILGINNALAQIRLGNGASLLAFGRLGISGPTGKNAFEILQEMSRNSTGLDPGRRMQLLGSLGVSPDMMRLFSLGPSQFGRMAAQGQVMGSKDIEAMNEFQEALGRFELTLRRDFIPVIVGVEPYLKDLADVLGFLITNVLGTGLKAAGNASRNLSYIGHRGVGNFLNDLSNVLIPDDPRNYMGTRTFHQTINQEIHSTADAETVAEIAGHHVSRAMVHAAKSFDNQGY